MAVEIKEAFGIEPELIEGTNGVFDIIAKGTMVFSKHQAERFPEHDEVLEALRTLGLS